MSTVFADCARCGTCIAVGLRYCDECRKASETITVTVAGGCLRPSTTDFPIDEDFALAAEKAAAWVRGETWRRDPTGETEERAYVALKNPERSGIEITNRTPHAVSVEVFKVGDGFRVEIFATPANR